MTPVGPPAVLYTAARSGFAVIKSVTAVKALSA